MAARGSTAVLNYLARANLVVDASLSIRGAALAEMCPPNREPGALSWYRATAATARFIPKFRQVAAKRR